MSAVPTHTTKSGAWPNTLTLTPPPRASQIKQKGYSLSIVRPWSVAEAMARDEGGLHRRNNP